MRRRDDVSSVGVGWCILALSRSCYGGCSVVVLPLRRCSAEESSEARDIYCSVAAPYILLTGAVRGTVVSQKVSSRLP